MGDDLFADAGNFHLGLGPLVLGDGKVQPDVDDGQHEEGEEGGDQEERLVEHREPVSERFKVKNLGNCFTAGEKRFHKLDFSLIQMSYDRYSDICPQQGFR